MCYLTCFLNELAAVLQQAALKEGVYMKNISKRRARSGSTTQLLSRVPLDPMSRARARVCMEKAERIADLVHAAGTAIPSAIAWLDRSAVNAGRRFKSAFTKPVHH